VVGNKIISNNKDGVRINHEIGKLSKISIKMIKISLKIMINKQINIKISKKLNINKNSSKVILIKKFTINK